MRCPQCQYENAPGDKFCGECGAALELICPACSIANVPTRKFCRECGARLAGGPAAAAPPPAAAAPVAAAPAQAEPATAIAPPMPAAAVAPVAPPPVTAPGPVAPASSPRFASPETYTPKHLAEKILTSKSALEGERKQVTVMFTDVSGFTAMSEALDPEEVHGIMDRAFEVILTWVHHYEGTINQFLGDGVMALFGAPVAHEDHADRATRAALAIQEGLKPLREDVKLTYKREFMMRIGINTGLVVVGAIGRDLRMDYTALGDTTNLAARLLNVAKPGQIVVSERIRRLRDGFFDFEDLGLFELKGKKEPARAFAVNGEIRGRTRLEVSRQRGLTPLVGREAERRQLTEMFARAREGQGAVVLISGEPGVGKSRLLYEFLRRFDDEEIRELEATCVSYGRTIAYRPITELFRRFLQLPEGVSDDEVRRRSTEQLLELDLESEETVILLAHFLGVSAPPEFLTRVQGAQLKERTHRMLGAMLARASEASPIVLVVENVHWIDASSDEFLKALVPTLSRSRVLLVLTTRPGPAIEWLPATAATITVEGLDAGDLRDMVRTILGAESVTEPLFELLLAKGAGNPLYIEEIVRQLRETDGIRVEDGTARLSAANVTVPDTINDIISARVDRLLEPLKHTLQVASVVGRRFGVPLVSRVVEKGTDRVADNLRDLHTLDFVFPNPDDLEFYYSFKHALTQDVVYASLLERRRRVFHAAVGAGLEALYADRLDDVVELLAYHFERSAEAEKAVDYAIRAAEKAQRRWANTEALALFEVAVKRLASMPDTEANRLRKIDAIVKQAEVMFALGRHAEHVEALEAIRDVVEASADPPRRAAWYYWAGFLHSLTGGRPEVPIAYCREASAVAEAAGLDEIRAFAESSLAHVYAVAGNLRDSVTAGERALAIFEARGNLWWACRTLWILNMSTVPLGQWDRSLEYCRQAMEHAQAVDDLRMKVVAWWRTGWTHIQRGDLKAGLRCCEEALALSPTPFDAAMAKAAQGYGLVKAGETGAGTAALAEAVAWFDQSRLRYTRSWYALWLGESHLRHGERAKARTVLDEALIASREVGYRHVEGIANRILGELLLEEDPAAAARYLEAAVQILDEIGARNEFAKALACQAELRRMASDGDGARKLLERALAIFEELGTLDEPPRVRKALTGFATSPA